MTTKTTLRATIQLSIAASHAELLLKDKQKRGFFQALVIMSECPGAFGEQAANALEEITKLALRWDMK